jgi:redox-sensitive bicupin YhaK (pirin superfamily)
MRTSLPPTHQIRRSASRGHLRSDWLDARFSFSFASYRDPLRTRFGPLLALNEDRVQPQTGFAMHPHRDLEILMIPLQGEIEHRDSQGGHAVVRCGDVQFMRTGRGIQHSQMNPSTDTVNHHLQIWLEPRTRDLEPSVEQRPLPATTASPWTCIASPDGRGDSFAIDADVTVEQAALAAQDWLEIAPQGRRRYLHVVSGEVAIHLDGGLEVMLRDGDALVAIDDRERLQLHGVAAVTRLVSFEAAGHDAMPAR